MAAADLLAILYWPLAALTAVAFWRWWKRIGQNAKKAGGLVIAAAFTFVVFTLVLGYGLANRSAIVLLDWQIFYLVVGIAMLAPVAVIVWLRPKTTKSLTAIVLLALLGLASVSYGAWQLAGDFLLPRETIEASVTDLKAKMSRSGPHYQVYLNGKHHPTTADVYDTLQVGDRVRASVSVTSGTIFDVEHVKNSPTNRL